MYISWLVVACAVVLLGLTAYLCQFGFHSNWVCTFTTYIVYFVPYSSDWAHCPDNFINVFLVFCDLFCATAIVLGFVLMKRYFILED